MKPEFRKNPEFWSDRVESRLSKLEACCFGERDNPVETTSESSPKNESEISSSSNSNLQISSCPDGYEERWVPLGFTKAGDLLSSSLMGHDIRFPIKVYRPILSKEEEKGCVIETVYGVPYSLKGSIFDLPEEWVGKRVRVTLLKEGEE